MKITDLSPGGYASTCYFVTEGKDAVLIDCSAPVSAVREALEQSGTRLHAILCTHGHFDHVLTADELRDGLDVPLLIHGEDAEMLADADKNAFRYFAGYERKWRPAERTFSQGDVLDFGALSFTVMHLPGHSKGSSAFLANGVAFTGDTIFANGFGRYDLYGGHGADLLRSLNRLKTVPPETVIYPGHGESAPLGVALDRIFQKNPNDLR